MPLLGAHTSTAGGLHTALDRGEALGCDTIQLFTKNNRQWQARPLADEEIATFRARASETGLAPLVSHATYLLNPASPKPDIWGKSLSALAVELERCRQLGVPYLVLHPGAHTGSGTEAGIERVAEALNRVHEMGDDSAIVCLEITAGQGSCLGADFGELAAIIERVAAPERVGICFDTCHALAAGYDLCERDAYEAVMAEFDATLGLDRLKVFHFNDSKYDRGGRRDRHTHIGRGFCGLDAFRFILNDPRFEGIPMLLETPKGDDMAEDRVNLRILRALIAGTEEEVDAATLDSFWEGIEAAEGKDE